MPRLGLLAAAFSNGTIGVYSLPHPEALAAHHQNKGEEMVNCITCASYFFSGVKKKIFIIIFFLAFRSTWNGCSKDSQSVVFHDYFHSLCFYVTWGCF